MNYEARVASYRLGQTTVALEKAKAAADHDLVIRLQGKVDAFFEVALSTAKPAFDIPLISKEDAEALIQHLVQNRLDFHFDDDPSEIVNGLTGARLFAEEDFANIRLRVKELNKLLDDPFETLDRLDTEWNCQMNEANWDKE